MRRPSRQSSSLLQLIAVVVNSSFSITLFLVVLAEVTLAQPIYKWKNEKGHWHFSDVWPRGVTGVIRLETPASAPKAPAAQAPSLPHDETEDKPVTDPASARPSELTRTSPDRRWLLIFPPRPQAGAGDTNRFLGWTPEQIFESEQTCNHHKAIVIANSLGLSDGVSSLNSRLLNSNCIPASEFISGEEADVIVIATRFEPVLVGFSSHLLYGKVFNRGQATARNVVTKYQIRDSNGSIIMQGEAPTSPGDIPRLTFSEFRTPNIGGWSLSGLSVQAEADWSKK